MTNQPKAPGAKGYELEEVLRLYFLEVGFFAVRSVPVVVKGEEVTDLDIWLYERPTGGSTRRRAFVDAKFRSKPKASERLLWARGVQQGLRLDGAYVATTDRRAIVKVIAKQFDVSLLDGSDLERVRSSARITSQERISEDEFLTTIRKVDRARRTTEWAEALRSAKTSLVDGLGARGANRALDQLSIFCRAAVSAHPDSEQAKIAVRASFICAAIAAINLDFIGAGVSLRPSEERYQTFVNSLRYGSEEKGDGLNRVRLATALVRHYLENGKAIAAQLEQALQKEADAIPAEIIADFIVKTHRADQIFMIARELEAAAYSRPDIGFDNLPVGARALMGTFLDFHGCSRTTFANALTTLSGMAAESNGVSEEPRKAGDASTAPPLLDRLPDE